jgi:hypothetical protein
MTHSLSPHPLIAKKGSQLNYMEDLMTHYLEHTPSNGRMIDEL